MQSFGLYNFAQQNWEERRVSILRNLSRMILTMGSCCNGLNEQHGTTILILSLQNESRKIETLPTPDWY